MRWRFSTSSASRRTRCRWLPAGRRGRKTVLGSLGELHPAILDRLGAAGPLAGFEVILDQIPAPRARPTKTKPPLVLSDLQPVRRDFAFLLDRSVEAGKVTRAAEG